MTRRFNALVIASLIPLASFNVTAALITEQVNFDFGSEENVRVTDSQPSFSSHSYTINTLSFAGFDTTLGILNAVTFTITGDATSAYAGSAKDLGDYDSSVSNYTNGVYRSIYYESASMNGAAFSEFSLLVGIDEYMVHDDVEVDRTDCDSGLITVGNQRSTDGIRYITDPETGLPISASCSADYLDVSSAEMTIYGNALDSIYESDFMLDQRIFNKVDLHIPKGDDDLSASAALRLDWAGSVVASYDYTAYPTAAVPEPSILALMGLGIFGLGLSRRKMKK